MSEGKDVIKIKPKAFKAHQKKVNAETDSLCINLQFIDSEENRQIEVSLFKALSAQQDFGIVPPQLIVMVFIGPFGPVQGKIRISHDLVCNGYI